MFINLKFKEFYLELKNKNQGVSSNIYYVIFKKSDFLNQKQFISEKLGIENFITDSNLLNVDNNYFFSTNNKMIYMTGINDFSVREIANTSASHFTIFNSTNIKNVNIIFCDNNKNCDDILKLYEEYYLSLMINSYNFDRFKTKKDNSVLDVCFFDINENVFNKKLAELNILKNSYFKLLDLCNMPSNILNPNTFLSYIADLEAFDNINIDVISKTELLNMNMNCLLSVGDGSIFDSNVLQITLNKELKDEPIVLIGKGVTFDTGGLCIKPSEYMLNMHKDMGGAAFCASIMYMLAENNIKDKKVIALLGLVENSVSSRSYKPNDIITSYSGKTVEIIDTDAEGRLVLADLISYACKKIKPSFIFDFATLTGAIVVALGRCCPGIFTNNDLIFNKLNDISLKNNDRIWRMPLFSYYDDILKSNVADLKNVAFNVGGQSILAAKFLEQFLDNDYKNKWMHLDIAGSFDDRRPDANNTLLLRTFYELILGINKNEI